MIAFDTEDDSQGTVTIINFFDGDKHETFVGNNCRYRAWSYLLNHRKETFWAVNAEYDLVNLFGDWLAKICTLQYVKAGFMRACIDELAGKKVGITFYDTRRHWPCTVEEMGKKIGLPKLSMPHLGCTCDDCVEYCRRDTEITWRFVSEMTERYRALGLDRIRSTLPSMALQLFKQFYAREFPRYEESLIRELRKAYYGGRVEVYRMGVINGPVKHYDVNSLFPSCMLNYSYPDLDSFRFVDSPNFEREGIFEGYVWIPYSRIPCLPVRDSELIFPYGEVYGAWCYPEIRQLLKDGGKILRCKQAIEFSAIENPFDHFVSYCYSRRLEAKDEIENYFWKLMLNSLYGKFGQSGEIEIIYDDEEKLIEGRANHANVIWSAYVTCYARLVLLDYLRRCRDVFYTDTDSLFTFDDLETSLDLGKLKLEGTYDWTEFKGNKIYCLVADSKRKYKAKGVPHKNQEQFFIEGKTKFNRPSRFRESRRRKIQPNIWSEVEKYERMSYTKRKILGNGDTEPWNFTEYKQRIK